jgi:hypothetical protein
MATRRATRESLTAANIVMGEWKKARVKSVFDFQMTFTFLAHTDGPNSHESTAIYTPFTPAQFLLLGGAMLS